VNKRRQPEAIGRIEQVKELAHELRRIVRMELIPRVSVNQIVGTGQAQVSSAVGS